MSYIKFLVVVIVLIGHVQIAHGQSANIESEKLSVSISGVRSAYQWRGGDRRAGAVGMSETFPIHFINPNIQVEFNINLNFSVCSGYWVEGYRFDAKYFGNNPIVDYLTIYKDQSLFIGPSYTTNFVESDKLDFFIGISLPLYFQFRELRGYALPITPSNETVFNGREFRFYGFRTTIDFELDFKKKSKFVPNPRLFLFSPHFLFNKNLEVNVTSTGVGVGLTWFVF